MRKPSRTMPATPSTPMTSYGVLILSFVALIILWFVCLAPMILIPIGVVALALVAFSIANRDRVTRLANEREGESICSFARSFERRSVDTWIIRAVFEELQPYCRSGRRTFALRGTDRLGEDLLIDEDEWGDLACDIAQRVGRSTEDWVKNPLFGSVETVSDLVAFLGHQPLRRIASPDAVGDSGPGPA